MDDDRLRLIEEVRQTISKLDDQTDILRATVQLIDGFSSDFNWTGFYILNGDILEVGPFVGPDTPHTRIRLNEGICGAAASRGTTVVVDDVGTDSRFLACSVTTQSEIVVPLMKGDQCLGEIDIDSNKPAAFSANDRAMIERIATLVVQQLSETS